MGSTQLIKNIRKTSSETDNRAEEACRKIMDQNSEEQGQLEVIY